MKERVTKRPKVLVMCQGGNSRSVAMGYLLKYKYNFDAIACSLEKNSEETLQMLFEWSEKIILMQGYMMEHVPKEFHNKVIVTDVGEDVWFCIPNYLVSLCDHTIKEFIPEILK